MNRSITDQQHLQLLALVNDLWTIAAKEGSMHSYWDVIMDIQAFIQGNPTIIQHSADEWIEYAKSLLSRQKRDL